MAHSLSLSLSPGLNLSQTLLSVRFPQTLILKLSPSVSLPIYLLWEPQTARGWWIGGVEAKDITDRPRTMAVVARGFVAWGAWTTRASHKVSYRAFLCFGVHVSMYHCGWRLRALEEVEEREHLRRREREERLNCFTKISFQPPNVFQIVFWPETFVKS